MSLPSVDGYMPTAVSMIVKVSVLLAAGALVQVVLRQRASAATRHLVWTLSVLGLLLLPMLSAVLPGWKVPVRLTATPGPDAAAIGERTDAPFLTVSDAGVSAPAVTTSARSALMALYAAGVLVLLARLIAEQVTIQRLARRATDVSEPEQTRLLIECARRMGVRRPVRLLRSREHTMPMVFGTRAPAIVLPAVADTWPQDRQGVVLLHELAHVARHDCLTQLAAAVACAVYWIHPGVWWVARRLRVERELACDDRVLTAGTHAREYAGHLLEVAFSLGGDRSSALAVSMARPRQLEGRLLAVLDTARNRSTPAPGSRLAGIAIMAALLTPLAGAEAVAIPAGADSPRSANPPYRIDEGPAIRIHSIEFAGNRAISSGTLKRQMKSSKEGSPYQERELSEDAEKIVGYYRDHGYLTVRVGAPELTFVGNSSGKNTRVVDLRIPVAEGHRYKVGELSFAGNRAIKSDDLRRLFKVERGTYYSDQAIRKGLMQAREAYGAGGYFEFTGYPDYTLRDRPDPAEPDAPAALKAESAKPVTGPSIVDITVRLQEGQQYFVNRLTFAGSTTRRDRVIRREVRLVEGGVFNTEALKDSVKRLNRLGYFRPIGGGTRGVDIRKTPGEDNKVDVELTLVDR
jgi:beta-lactamase regulating signal transducer with metallopeptidase domain